MTTKLVFFILLFSSSILYSQSNGVVTYGQKIISTKLKKSNEKSEFSNFYDKQRDRMSRVSENIVYKLKFNKEEASFSTESTLSIDEYESDIEYALLHVRGDGTYYFSSKNSISLWDHNVFGKRIILADTVNSDNWLITKETKTIGKYKTIKAVKKKKSNNGKEIEVIAWFAPEISNNYGPLGYYGLPGLILEIHEKDFIIYIKNINFKKKSPKITEPTKGVYMGEKEYKIYLKKAAIDFING